MSNQSGPPRRAVRVGLLLAATAMVLSGSVSFAAHVSPVVIATIPVGDAPRGVGVNPNTNRIYIANSGPGFPFPGPDMTVSVINGGTNAVETTVPVGKHPRALGVNPTTNRIYVANSNSSTVSVINGATNAVVATIPLPAFSAPDTVAVNTNTNKVYVATTGAVPNTVRVIDGTIGSPTENTIIKTISLGLIDLPGDVGLAVNPVTNRIYVATIFPLPWALRVIDGATDTLTATNIPLAVFPTGVAADPETNRIYVVGFSNVVVINGDTNATITTVGAGAGAFKVDLNPSTDRAYVINASGNDMTVLRTDTNAVIATVALPNPRGVAVNTATDRVYVSDVDGDAVKVIAHPTTVATINDLIAAVQALPLDKFKSVGIGSGAFQAILFSIENKINDGRIAEAIESLLSLRQHVDGCGAEPDNNDWILDCADQEAIRNLIDAVIAGL